MQLFHRSPLWIILLCLLLGATFAWPSIRTPLGAKLVAANLLSAPAPPPAPPLFVSSTENVVGWSSWVNFTTFTADLGLTSNSGVSVLSAPGATSPITVSDAGDGFGQRAFTTGWASGANSKAWQFSFSTLKYGTLKFSCKMMGTNSPFGFYGPRDFKLQYSLNGSSWTDVSGGTLQAGNGNGNFNSLTNVSLPVACENQATVYLRMLMTSNTSVNGSTVSGGQSHIDDILVTGASIPEAPTDITIAYAVSPFPPVASNTLVGTLGSVDFNVGDTFTYSLVSGTGSTDNASFSISGNQLLAATTLTNTSYSVRIRSTDDTGRSFEKVVPVTFLAPDAFLSGGSFRISTMGGTGNTSFSASNAAVAFNATNNEFLVVWSGDDNTSPLVDNENEIFGQRMNGTTGALVGSRIRISSMGTDGSTSFSASRPDVVWNATNNEYLVVWDGDDNTSPLVDNENEIFGQRLAGATGALTGSRIRISSMGTDGNTSFRAISAAATWNSTNNEYLVVWQGDDNTSPLIDNEDEIFGQRLAGATGALSGSRLRISTMGTAGNANFDASVPDVAWNATNNEYFAVWRADDDTSPLIDNEFEIYGQRIAGATGTLTASRVRISTMGPNGDTNYSATTPRLAWSSANNEYLVVWSGDDNTSPLVDNENEIFGQRVNATNAALTGSRIRISDMGTDGSSSYNAATPGVVWSASTSEYVIVWSGDDQSSESVDNENEVFAQRLDKDGVAQGTNDFRISAMGPLNDANYDTFIPAIAAGASGKLLTVWHGDTNTNSLVDSENEIHGQLLSGTTITAPVITAGSALSRTQGATASSATIATVSDVETAAGSLTVTATTVPTGITVSSITNTSGTITANVAAGCSAATGANTVVLTVTDGSGLTATANLTVNVASGAVSISTHPATQSVLVGNSVTFSVTATNAVSYQWRKGGTNISGATSSTYTINPTVTGDAGSYDVVVTGACGSATSNAATLTVNVPTISSATYDANTGVLAVTAANMVTGNTIVANKLTLTGEGASTYTLTTANVTATSATAFSVTLNATDKAAVNQIINRNGTFSTNGTTYNLAAQTGWNASIPSDADSVNSITVSNVAVPIITSATYNASTGVLVVTGIGLLKKSGTSNDIVVNKLRLSGQGGGSHTLTDSTNVEITSDTTFSVTLSSTDRAAVSLLLNRDGTSAADSTTYNLAALEDWAAGADAAVVVADLTSNAITVSNAPPLLGNYPNASVTAGGNTTVTPDATPTNTTSVTASAPGFTGLLFVHPTTGVVSVNNAQPAGTYTITVRAFGTGGSATRTFTLTVNHPPACNTTSFSSTHVSVGIIPASVTTGDFNGDGRLDFAAANQSSNTVSIHLGDGAGNFSGTTNVSVGSAPYSVATGDFNGDGRLDFAAANNGSNTVSIRLGDGAGNFSGTTNVSVGGFPRTVATGDFNGDGKLDFAAANADGNTVSIRLNSCNTAPTITAGSALSRTQAAAASNATIATVSDVETAAGSLTVTATTVPTGITVSSITNTNGTITANVAASCTATIGANTVVLTVTDAQGGTATANLTINVSALSVPAVTTHPTAQSGNVGDTVTFSVIATNADTYQWQVSINGGQFWTDVSGATTATLSFSARPFHNANRYRVKLSNCKGDTYSSNVLLTVNAGTDASALGLVIREFRLRGSSATNAAQDEYIVLHNTTSADITVATTDASAGWAVAALSADGNASTIIHTIPNGTVIPAKGNYLLVNSNGYSLGAVATGDVNFAVDGTTDLSDDSGLALFNTANAGSLNNTTRIDAVGFQSTGTAATLFREGTGLSNLGTINGEYAWMRKINNGRTVDTNNNANDFVLIATSGGNVNGVTAQIGAPNPLNLTSPIERNSDLFSSSFDGTVAATATPNRVRDTTPVTNGDFGVLILRHTITNNSGVALKKLRFRIIDITNAATGTEADLRLLGSVTSTVNGQTVEGLTLEQPPTQSNGGGVNSTVAVGTITTVQPLAAGATVNVEFKLGVMRAGRYRFFLNIEAKQ